VLGIGPYRFAAASKIARNSSGAVFDAWLAHTAPPPSRAEFHHPALPRIVDVVPFDGRFLIVRQRVLPVTLKTIAHATQAGASSMPFRYAVATLRPIAELLAAKPRSLSCVVHPSTIAVDLDGHAVALGCDSKDPLPDGFTGISILEARLVAWLLLVASARLDPVAVPNRFGPVRSALSRIDVDADTRSLLEELCSASLHKRTVAWGPVEAATSLRAIESRLPETSSDELARWVADLCPSIVEAEHRLRVPIGAS